VKLMRQQDSGVWKEVTAGSPFLPVLRRPNRYQTRVQFIELWVLSKLLYGNTYVLKARDARSIVTALHVLDAQRVTPLVTPSGDVYYQIKADHLAGFTGDLIVPASEIIHDRMNCFWHPLVGVPPIYAAAMSATQGRRIQTNSATFFENMSRPGGMLTAPATIAPETAIRLKSEFEANFSGSKLGRLFVGGDGLQFNAMSVPAEQSQLIEQLGWTGQDIARAFLVPYFMVGGPIQAGVSVEAETLRYYQQCLQKMMEQTEACLDEGLSLPTEMRTEFEIADLIRMDTIAQADVVEKLSRAGVLAPNEGRARFNLEPVTGGEYPLIQQQNYSLAALAKRDAKADPFATEKPPSATPAPAANDEPDPDEAREVADYIEKALA
jgi:HK97 family phage portal protein